jgi:hypothetical protein
MVTTLSNRYGLNSPLLALLQVVSGAKLSYGEDCFEASHPILVVPFIGKNPRISELPSLAYDWNLFSDVKSFALFTSAPLLSYSRVLHRLDYVTVLPPCRKSMNVFINARDRVCGLDYFLNCALGTFVWLILSCVMFTTIYSDASYASITEFFLSKYHFLWAFCLAHIYDAVRKWGNLMFLYIIFSEIVNFCVDVYRGNGECGFIFHLLRDVFACLGVLRYLVPGFVEVAFSNAFSLEYIVMLLFVAFCTYILIFYRREFKEEVYYFNNMAAFTTFKITIINFFLGFRMYYIDLFQNEFVGHGLSICYWFLWLLYGVLLAFIYELVRKWGNIHQYWSEAMAYTAIVMIEPFIEFNPSVEADVDLDTVETLIDNESRRGIPRMYFDRIGLDDYFCHFPNHPLKVAPREVAESLLYDSDICQECEMWNFDHYVNGVPLHVGLQEQEEEEVLDVNVRIVRYGDDFAVFNPLFHGLELLVDDLYDILDQHVLIARGLMPRGIDRYVMENHTYVLDLIEIAYIDRMVDRGLFPPGRPAWLARQHNALMHAIRGNIDVSRDTIFSHLHDEHVQLGTGKTVLRQLYSPDVKTSGFVFHLPDDTKFDEHEVEGLFRPLFYNKTLTGFMRDTKEWNAETFDEFIQQLEPFSSKMWKDYPISFVIQRLKKARYILISCNGYLGVSNGVTPVWSNKIKGTVRKAKVHKKRLHGSDTIFIIQPECCDIYNHLPVLVASLSDAKRRLRHKSWLLSKGGTVKVAVNDAGSTIMCSISMQLSMVRELFSKVSFFYPSGKVKEVHLQPMKLTDFLPLGGRKNYVVCGVEMVYISDLECVNWARNNGFKNQVSEYVVNFSGSVEFNEILQDQINNACVNGRLTLIGKIDLQAGKASGLASFVGHFGGGANTELAGKVIDLTALLAFLDLVYKADSMLSVFEITFLYVRDMQFPACIIDEIEKLSNNTLVINLQAGGSTPLWESCEFTAMAELYRLFAKISWHSVIKMLPNMSFGGFSLKMPLLEFSKNNGFFGSVVRVVTYYLERFKECYRLGSLKPLLDPFSSPSELHKRALSLQVYETLLCGYNATARQKRELAELIDSKVVSEAYSNMMTPTEYGNEVALVQNCVKDMLLHWENDAPAMMLLRDSLKTLELVLVSLRTRSLITAGRKQPYGIVLFGKAGMGKSALVNLIHATACTVLGVPSEGTKAIWTDTNFQDTYNPMSISVVLDDIDHSMHYSEFNHAKAIRDCVGVESQYLEAARAEEKGTRFATHSLCIYVTNYRELNLTSFTTQKQAIFRRLPNYAEVRIREDIHSGPLMPGFVHEAGRNIHEIDWYEYDDGGTVDFPYRLVYPKISTKSFLCLFRDRFQKYTDQTCVDDWEKCPNCNVHPSVCTCSPFVLQSGAVELLGNSAVTSLFTGFIMFVIFECYLRSARLKFVEVYRQCLNYWNNIKFVYYSYVNSAKALKIASFIIIGRLESALSVSNVAIVACISAALIMWKSQTAKYNLQMGAVQSSDAVFRRVTMQPQVAAFTPAPATWTKEELIRLTQQRILLLRVRGEGLQFAVRGLRYGVDLILTTSHIIHKFMKDDDVLEVHNGTQIIALSKLSIRYERVPRTYDLCVLQVPGLAGGLSVEKHIYVSIPANISAFDGAEYVMESETVAVSSNLCVNADIQMIASSGYLSKQGDCGYPLIVADKKSWRIAGMHFGNLPIRMFATPPCMADRLERASIDEAVRSLGMKHVELIPVSLQCGNLPIGPTPNISSVGAFLGTGAKNAMYIGTLQGMHKTTFKSHLKVSPAYPYFRDIITEICGEPMPYVIPTTKGSLDDNGFWVDAYTEKMKDPMPESFPDDDILWLCVADYLLGSDKLASEIEVPAKISIFEALRGNPELHVTPTNMNSSAGPPFARPKSKVVETERDGQLPVAYEFNEESARLYTQMDAALTEETAPWVFSNVFVKDESVKPNKQKLPRLINNLPFSFNLLSKQYLVGVRSILRRFPTFFECMVGINIMSDQVVRVSSHLLSKDGKYRTIEYDFKWFDLTQRGLINAHVSNVFWALAFITGGFAGIVRNIVVAGNKAIYCYNSDCISYGCRNPSGSDTTVEFNSITNSIAIRYAYYRGMKLPDIRLWVAEYKKNFFKCPVVELPFGVVRFRDQVALVTYGDDGLAATKLDLGLSLNMYVSELGMEITDGHDKSPIVKVRPLIECSFLKRTFTEDRDMPFMTMPLDKKAICRMLIFLGTSALTETDHMSVILNDVLKESFLHGRDFYERMKVLVTLASDELGLSVNRYLFIRDYDVHRSDFLAGAFTTWSMGMEKDF